MAVVAQLLGVRRLRLRVVGGGEPFPLSCWLSSLYSFQAEPTLVHACTGAILPLLPGMWSAAEEENLMRIHIVSMLQQVHEAAAGVLRPHFPHPSLSLRFPWNWAVTVRDIASRVTCSAAV